MILAGKFCLKTFATGVSKKTKVNLIQHFGNVRDKSVKYTSTTSVILTCNHVPTSNLF